MSHFPILQEMFESDSVIFSVIGLILGRAVGMKLKSPKANLVGALISAVVYGLCEVLTHSCSSYMLSFVLLGVGTVAIGAAVALLISAIIEKVRGKGENHDA